MKLLEQRASHVRQNSKLAEESAAKVALLTVVQAAVDWVGGSHVVRVVPSY